MAKTTTGPIMPGAPIRAEDIRSIQRTADHAADISGGHGANFNRGPGGITGVLEPPALNLKTYSVLYGLNDGSTIIQPGQYAVITGNVYDALGHPFQQGRNQIVNVRHATADADNALHWGVAVDAIPLGQMGRFCVGGVCMAVVLGVVGTDEDNVQLKNEYASSDRYLRITAAGTGQMLWHNTADYALDAAHPALVRFPSGGGGADYVVAANITALNAVAGDYTPPRQGYTEDNGYYWALNLDSTAWWCTSHTV